MEIPKLIIILYLARHGFASDHSLQIPVENYETELQNLGQHVDIPETPVKVIKITKTVAVKIPVPYPVKVIEKVPYPVHVAKPYPVPVTQIVHVPQPTQPNPHHGYENTDDVSHGRHGGQQQDGQSYQVQEFNVNTQHSNLPSQGIQDNADHSPSSFGDTEHGQSYGAAGDYKHSFTGSQFGGPSSYYGYSGDNDGQYSNAESKKYNQAILKHHPKMDKHYN